MSMVGFPLLLIPLAIYNIIAFLMPGLDSTTPLATLSLMSGKEWPVTLGDALLALGIVMLLFEVIKGARPGAKFLTDHLLSLIVFGAALAEFLLWPRFASSAYFLLTLLALVDFLSGVALRVRRGVPATVGASRGARSTPVEARREPADLPAVQPASINEPIIPAPSEPTFAHPEPVIVPAPEPPAGSQAGNASPQPPEAAH